MPSELFSIVTAARNARATIGETLASVACQTHVAKEHVIQDGNSSDGTPDAVRAFASPQVKLASEKDSGIYDAFNRGLRRVTGSIVAFIGADDRYENERVFERVAGIFEDPCVDMVFGDALIVRRDDPSSVVRRYSSAKFAGIASLRNGFMPAHTALFVRRKVYEQTGEFDTSYRITGDFEWLVRAFRDRPPVCVHIPEPLTRMRIGGMSSAGALAAWRVTREFHRACHSNGLATSYPRLLWRIPRKALEFRFPL